MKPAPTLAPRSPRTPALALGLAALAGCARSSTMAAGSAPSPDATPASASAAPPSPDPRVGLRAGWWDAGQASWNLRLVSNTRPSAQFTNASTPGDARLTNSDLAFTGRYVFQGNYSGYQVWDVADPRRPRLHTSFVCPGSQSDVTVYHQLLFVSAEATSGRLDCGMQGVADTVSHERARGIRVFDISDVTRPRAVATVQTCRGSHTNTLVTDPRDSSSVYVYVSGSAGVRSSSELAGCSAAMPEQDPNTALFRIEVIKVPVAHPEQAAIVSSPRIFQDLGPATRHGESAADQAAGAERLAALAREGRAPGQRPGASRGPTQCHDITAYPAIGLAGGACSGYGILLDIRDPAHPVRIGAVADTNFSAWHSVTFSNDGGKVLFSDEWGGGSQPRCRRGDRMEWGADAIFTLAGARGGPSGGAAPEMRFQSYYKLSAPQTPNENCVAHNGSLVPIPGRDVMVQSWYQGGVSVFDWTDAAHPREIAYFDRGPMDSTRLVNAGHWSAYWYNGYIYGSEISRGLDILELAPSADLSQNEIDAAKSVRFDYFNPQDQPKLVWPATFALPRAYLDQLERSGGLARDQIAAARQGLAAAERQSGGARRDTLTRLATQMGSAAPAATDAAKVRVMAAAIEGLAGAVR